MVWDNDSPPRPDFYLAAPLRRCRAHAMHVTMVNPGTVVGICAIRFGERVGFGLGVKITSASGVCIILVM
jgi:hypothetical protein